MANSKLNGPRYKYASIDTAPGADGYWSESVSMSSVNSTRLQFSRTGGGVADVVIQFKLAHAGATWQDYDSPVSLVDGVRCVIDDNAAGVKWRAGVKEDTSADPTYTSGTVIVGFDW